MLNFIIQMRKPLILWFSLVLFFAFQFILRLSPGILMDDIMCKYHVDTSAFGTMLGIYYLGYSFMQIPWGIMLDKYNFRYVTILGILIAVIGNATFIVANDWSYILLGRLMIGIGSAVGFLSVIKVIKTFFEEKHHSFMIGFSFTVGLTGGVFGAKPMKMLINHFGYVEVLAILCIIALIISCVIFFVKHEHIVILNSESEPESLNFIKILSVIIDPKILLICISGGLLVGSLEGFADAWSFVLFEQIYNFGELDSKFLASVIYIGMLFGGPVLAYFADYIKSYVKVIIFVSILMSLIFVLMLIKIDWSYYMLFVMMFLLGILCCYQVLVFSLISSIVDKARSGVAMGVVNCINMSFGYIFHKILAHFMEINWDGDVSITGGRIYDYDAIFQSVSVIPVASVIGMLGFMYFLKYEKYSR